MLFPYGLFSTMKTILFLERRLVQLKERTFSVIQESVYVQTTRSIHIRLLQYLVKPNALGAIQIDPDKEDKKVLDDSNDFLNWMRKISARYVGSEKADRYAKRNTTEGAVLYRLKFQHVVSEKVIADW